MLQWLRSRKFILSNPEDIVFVHTKGARDINAKNSLGGSWGEEFPARYFDEIFPPEEELREYRPGSVIYRAIGIKNISSQTLYFINVHFRALPIAPDFITRPPVDFLFAGWAKEPINTPPAAIADEYTESPGIVWNKVGERLKMPEYCLRPGDIKGLWLKLQITEYTPRIPAALLIDWALLHNDRSYDI